ncbi:tripartite tricarboxylate transporter TctB family protein (plasmid) [Rhizobium sophoriradicis]|uniref:tripartite tricarboxylate transporter TctB family protein n=1 Tax=Rhizobium sophoriradicis TaxID=1535245 RepID=UPI001608070A|nr:tripartite tricarboxylate transporter TctB family protein [Rhizobium leguminosarum bv. phaseoli]
MTVNINQDGAAGAMFVLAGAAGLFFAVGYDFGNLARVGPGFLPTILSIGLIVLGMMIAVNGLRSGMVVALPQARPILTILGGLGMFIALLRPAGLVPAATLAYLFLSFGGGNRRRLEALIVGTVFAIFIAVVFVVGLKLPLQLFWW